MTERPILFSTPMVRAIIAGKKTMTRRVIKFHWTGPIEVVHGPSYFRDDPRLYWRFDHRYPDTMISETLECPFGVAGDRLWVRETWAQNERGLMYRADNDATPPRWRPAIHMPRRACRIILEIKSVGVERIQDIDEWDAMREGIIRIGRSATKHGRLDGYGVEGTPPESAQTTARWAFAKLWDELNADRGFGWDKSPWVWVISFGMVR